MGITAVINRANYQLKDLTKSPQIIKLESLNDITVSLIDKRNLQFLLITHRGVVSDQMVTMMHQFKIMYPFITLILVSDTLDVNTNIKLFKAGVDHNINYSNDPEILTQRISSILKSKKQKPELLPKLHLGDLTLDPNNRKVARDNTEIKLRRKEFDLLEFFMQNAGRVFNRSELLETVWGYRYDTFSNTVDVHISSLRRKLDGDFCKKILITVHGRGYKLEY